MDVIGNIDFKGKGGKIKRAVFDMTDFPANPAEGEFLFKDRKVYVCVKVQDGLPFWVPLTQEINTVRFDQGSPALEWTINHNLNTNLVTVQVYDVDGKQVLPSEVDCSEENTCLIIFAVPVAGSAILMYGNELVGEAHANVAYTENFSGTTWVVNHGLGYNPNITCIVDGYVVQPYSIVHNSLNQTTITFSASTTGSVRCV